jgi:hypothetical protein
MQPNAYRLAVVSAFAALALGLGLVLSDPARAQRLLSVVFLQESSPGQLQRGHANIDGTLLAGRVGINTFQPPIERLEVDGNIKATALIASRYPRLIGLRENSTPTSVIYPNQPRGWIDVPVDSRNEPMQLMVLSGGPGDVFMATYSLRCDLQAPGFNLVGVRVFDQALNIVDARIGDGSDSPGAAPTVLRAAGTIMISGLPAGQYFLRLGNNAEVGTRIFSERRQFAVYQVR